MARPRLSAPGQLLICLLLLSSGCGGSADVQVPPPPPPQPDFSIGFSQNSISVQQGTTSQAVNVSVSPLNGFTGTVQMTLSDLPAGVAANPSSPFNVAAGSSAPVIFSAASDAGTGSFTVTATGASGSISHPASLGISVQSGVAVDIPRTTFARTDSVPAFDDPAGEFHHRHLAYDPVHQLLFVANRAMNRVDIFSSSSAMRVAQVSVPGASSADLSADASTVWVGTVTEQPVAIDTTSLQIKTRYEISGIQPLPNTLFDRPEEMLALANGNLMMRLRQSQSAESLLALWTPTSNTVTNLTTTEPQLFQNGLGAMARTGDQTKVIVAASDASGEIAIYNANGGVLAGPHGVGSGTIPLVAANPDGSRFAVDFVANGVSQVSLLDSSFNQTGSYTASAVNGMVFSRDGQLLYLSENVGAPPVITVLDGHTLAALGQVPDLWIAGKRTEIEDLDSTRLVFGIANRGIALVDAANPASLSATIPSFNLPSAAQLSDGPNSGGTVTSLTGQNFSSSSQVNFGTQTAATVNVPSGTQINATSPANAVAGAVNVTAYFPNGWVALAPDAFSYGPQILLVLPNAGTSTGGDSVQVYGYGFGNDATKITAKLGGANVAVLKVDNVSSIAPSLGLDATYPFPLERITLQTPSGVSGKADLSIVSPAGSITASKAFQYLQSESFYAKPSFDKFILYDQSRQWLYLSNIDHVDVFDLNAGAFRPSAIEPPGGPPPSAELRGLGLTPDSSELVAADFGAQSIYLLDPDNGSGSSVSVGGVPGFTSSGPSRVAATSTQNVFVGLSAESGSSAGCTSCLGQLNLTANPPVIEPAAQPEIMSLTGAPLVQSIGSGNQVFVAFVAAPGGPLALWNAASPNQFSTVTANDTAADIGVASNGSMFALQVNGATEIRGADLSLASVPVNPELLQIPDRNQVPGVTLHPSGALVYQPFLTGPASNVGVQGGVDILDAHSGVLRLRILLPQQFMTDVDGLHGEFFTIDENGQRLFAITSTDGTAQNAGITVVSLAKVPLGIGSMIPANGPSAGGTQITLSGSGFQSGTTVTIGGKTAAVNFKDMNTLTVVAPALPSGTQRVTITNPDGETVSLDAAFVSN